MRSLTIMTVFWYIFPVILLFAANFIVKMFSLDSRFKIKSVDLSVPFLLIGMHEISSNINQNSIVPYALITIFLAGMIIAIVHLYYYREIRYRRYFKMYWRVVFLLTLFLYIVVIIFSIYHNM